MDRIRKTRYKNKDILIIDYSDCTEKEMMDIVSNTGDIILAGNEMYWL